MLRLLKRLIFLLLGFAPSQPGSARSKKSRVPRWLRGSVLWPIIAFRRFARSFFHSLTKRKLEVEFRRIVYGLPFILCLFFAVFSFTNIFAEPDESLLLSEYKRAAEQAYESKLYNESRLLFERVLQLNPESNEDRLAYAVVLARLKDKYRYRLLIESLAPANRAVYAPAHVLRATTLGQDLSRVAPEKREFIVNLIVTHLQHAISLDRFNPVANSMLGRHYFIRGRFADAILYFEISRKIDRETGLLMISALKKLGRGREAVEVAEELLEACRKDLEASPTLPGPRIFGASALAEMGRFREADSFISRGIGVVEQSRVGDLQRAQSMLHWQWARALMDRASPISIVMPHLIRSIELDPERSLAFGELMKVMSLDEESRVQVVDELKRLISNGQKVPVVHLILGTHAVMRKEPEEAERHLEMAFALSPESYEIANNFAWQLMVNDPPECERALQIVDSMGPVALETPEVRDTRGQILFRLGRVDEALNELVIALPGMTQNQMIHETLVKCYERKGFKDLAEKHRNILVELKARDDL